VGCIIVLAFIVALFLLIGLSERHEAINPGTGSVSKAWVLKSIAMIGIALFAVWRGRKDMRKH
jgi:hypothetical protein